jgi:hypothetical protein
MKLEMKLSEKFEMEPSLPAISIIRTSGRSKALYLRDGIEWEECGNAMKRKRRKGRRRREREREREKKSRHRG